MAELTEDVFDGVLDDDESVTSQLNA